MCLVDDESSVHVWRYTLTQPRTSLFILGVFDVLISLFSQLERLSEGLSLKGLKDKFEDAAEVTRIVR